MAEWTLRIIRALSSELGSIIDTFAIVENCDN